MNTTEVLLVIFEPDDKLWKQFKPNNFIATRTCTAKEVLQFLAENRNKSSKVIVVISDPENGEGVDVEIRSLIQEIKKKYQDITIIATSSNYNWANQILQTGCHLTTARSRLDQTIESTLNPKKKIPFPWR